jgi:putative CocE/NonD family hydrolase
MKRLSSKASGALIILLIAVGAATTLDRIVSLQRAVAAAEQPPVVVEYGVRARMTDGISLVADVYRPGKPGKFPALLERTPYNRKGDAATANELASHDYVVVLQDTRGRYDSEGEFYPFRHESKDGYDSVEWAASLPYSNGQVGMFGGSYVGATQMLAAIAKPPHLLAIFPYVTASEYYDGWTYQNGALMQWFAGSWSSGLAVDTLRRKTEARIQAKQWVEQLPVEEYSMLSLPPVSELAPYYRDWVEHETDDEYWKPWKISEHHGDLEIKSLHGGGWHDIFLKGTLTNYLGIRKGAATQAAREGTRLIVGPWAHAATSPEGKIGDVVFGRNAVLNSTQTALAWFDYALKGLQDEYAVKPPVRIFVMGDNTWRDENEFPPARARSVKYFFHSTRGANGIAGDGLINVNAPVSAPVGAPISAPVNAPVGERADTYDYDPRHPVPTIGGRLCCGAALPPGPFDQSANEKRADVLVFSTPPLEKNTEVTGFITVELYAATSARDTDFTAMLVDVDTSGYARFLTDGVVRARYRNNTKQAEEIIPGQIYKYTIDLWATSNAFKTGHKIRVYVSSSNFPRFSRNLNTAERTLGSTRMVVAKQTIYHDALHPSSIILPIVPR